MTTSTISQNIKYMGLFSFLFGSENIIEKLPFEGIIKFKRVESDFKIRVGDEVNIWGKPNSTIVNLYAKGSAGGRGIVGFTNNKFINSHIISTEYLIVENTITEISNNYIKVKIKMHVDKESIENTRKEYEEEWIKKILSKYNPKNNWSFRFYYEEKLENNNLKINIIGKDNVSNYFNNTKDLIWLENLAGEKINAENTAYSEDIIKTLRAIYSGHEIEIISIIKDRNYYNLEIGKKNK